MPGQSTAALYGLLYLVLTAAYAVLHHLYYFGYEQLSICIRVGCSALIYRKVQFKHIAPLIGGP